MANENRAIHFAYRCHKGIRRVRRNPFSQKDDFVTGVAKDAAYGIGNTMINEEAYRLPPRHQAAAPLLS
jgi:hypothetical protein